MREDEDKVMKILMRTSILDKDLEEDEDLEKSPNEDEELFEHLDEDEYLEKTKTFLRILTRRRMIEICSQGKCRCSP